MPFLKNYVKPPFPIISEDPKLKPLEQDAEYHFTTGYPGPLTPAADEVYQQFIMVDALAVRDRQDGPRADDQVGRGEDQGDLRQVRLPPVAGSSGAAAMRRGPRRASAPEPSAPAAQPRIEHVAEGVTQHVEAKDGQRDRRPRPEGHPRRAVHERAPGAREHGAPGRVG